MDKKRSFKRYYGKYKKNLDAGVNTAISRNDGNYGCRCVQKITRPDGQRTYDGMVVWSPDGVWLIPRR